MNEIDDNIRCTIEDKKEKKFVIYTNGMGGRLVREYLESEFQITTEYTIDNKMYNGADILNIEQAKKRKNEDTYFLICSWHKDYYDEIRKVIYEAFQREQIIDVFPNEDVCVLPSDGEILEILDYVDSYTKELVEEGCM